MLQHLTIAVDLVFSTDVSLCRPLASVHLHHLCDIAVYFIDNRGVATLFRYLRVDNLERLFACCDDLFEDIAMLEHVCHFFNSCYHGDSLQYLLYDMIVLRMHRCIVSPGMRYAPSLCLQHSNRTDPSIVVNLLHRCVPRTLEAFEAKTLVFTECDSVDELRFTRSSNMSPLFEFDDASPSPYPSLLRFHFEDASPLFPKSEQIPRSERWLARRKSKLELVIIDRAHALLATDIESLREVAVVHLLCNS